MSSETGHSISRRGLLAGGLSAAAILTSTSIAGSQGRRGTPRSEAADGTPRRGRRRTPVGLQLYSVRKDCEKDLPGTIEAVAKMGYQGVEFAGYYGRTAEQLARLLKDNGLSCCGTHTGIDTLLGDNLQKTIDFNKTIGNRYLIVPGLPDKYRTSRQAWLDTAKLFNELAEKVKQQEMLVGYHNHGVEFQPMDGEMPWDTFYGNTAKDVVMQLDVGNASHGGVDPLPYLYKYPERAVTVHVKEFSKTNNKALIGEGDINWRAFFALCRAVGATEWYIIEHETEAYPPLKCVEMCFNNLREMRLI